MNDKPIGYITPTNAIISGYDYQFLSTSEQNQCEPIRNLEDLEQKTKLNYDRYGQNTFKTE